MSEITDAILVFGLRMITGFLWYIARHITGLRNDLAELKQQDWEIFKRSQNEKL